MTKEEIEKLDKEFKEMEDLVQQLSSLSIRVHVAAERALQAFSSEGNGNGGHQPTVV